MSCAIATTPSGDNFPEDPPDHISPCPALDLPYDVVAEVFLQVLPTYPTAPPIFGRFSPSVLAQICAKWREVALTTPALWRAISVSSRQLKSQPQRSRYLLEISLDRSGSFPLAIRIGDRAQSWRLGNAGDEPGLTRVLETIVRHSARWEHVALCMLAPLSRLPAVPLPLPLPLLRTLILGDVQLSRGETQVHRPAWEWYEDADPSALASPFSATPLLRKLNLEVCDGIYPSILPWTQLTVVDVGSIPARHCLDMLGLLVNIVHCRLKVQHWAWGDNGPRNVTLPRLETFIFETSSFWENPPASLLDMLTLPALTRLSVTETLLWRDDPVATLVAFIARSGCDLQELCVANQSSWHAQYRRSKPQDYSDAMPSVALFIFDGPLGVPEPFLRSGGKPRWRSSLYERPESLRVPVSRRGEQTRMQGINM
ncbi:hypothetical protein C8R46DRAFT_1346367 [Mycena filopes]|nr:hypothetical protein C8R46DRAFT_1346367 [Mycena filopes]